MRTEHLLSILVCLAASAGAFWLAKTDPGVADAPAQLLPQEFRVAAAETGRLAELPVAVGQRVKAGQLLARLDTTILEQEIAVAEARLKQLETEPAASAAQLETDGYAEERSFQADVSHAAAELENAQTAQATQAAELRSLQQEMQRQQGLVKEGLSRADRVEELSVKARSIAELSAVWPERMRALQARLQQAEARLAAWRSHHKPNATPESQARRLQPLRSKAVEQQHAISVLRAKLATARILAPADGEVVSVLARPGDVASSGTPILVLHGTGPRMLVAYVNERARLQNGAQAVARRRSPAGEEFSTRVQRVGDNVVQLPPRFWQFPTLPIWGREVFLAVPESVSLDGGEALDVKFLAGGMR